MPASDKLTTPECPFRNTPRKIRKKISVSTRYGNRILNVKESLTFIFKQFNVPLSSKYTKRLSPSYSSGQSLCSLHQDLSGSGQIQTLVLGSARSKHGTIAQTESGMMYNKVIESLIVKL